MPNHKSLLLFLYLLLLFSPSLMWADINAANGFYLGGNLNFAVYEPVKGTPGMVWRWGGEDHRWPMPTTTIRPYIGYRFNDYLAIESGYTLLDYDHNSRDLYHSVFYAIDFAVKRIYPFSTGFSLYGKAGLVYAHQDVFNQLSVDETPIVDRKDNEILPLIGVGLSYNFTQHFSSELFFTHAQGRGIGAINNIEIVGLGLSYTFGK